MFKVHPKMRWIEVEEERDIEEKLKKKKKTIDIMCDMIKKKVDREKKR